MFGKCIYKKTQKPFSVTNLYTSLFNLNLLIAHSMHFVLYPLFQLKDVTF